ncbi:hypothetical protein [Mycobacterium hubeiense]|uniref:hypothetical protein n=1 Tax=Mycobacterium hubeiense TaxID=1867256 RepID=UPI000C7F76AB|nr:hypothetical protein [Mycobacterium sp. QGD 101]
MVLRKPTGNIGEALANTQLPAKPRSLRAQIAELGGVKAAAAVAGRSVSSVYRWLRGVNKPSASAKGALDQASDALRATKDYRRGKLAARREKRFRKHGARFRFKGVAGPKNDSPQNSIRPRHLMADISAEGMADILDAWVNDGDEAALEALGEVLAGEYMNGETEEWQFDSIDLLKFSYSEFSP